MTLYSSYSTYTDTTSKTLLKRLSDPRDIKQRTILISNLSTTLSTRASLEAWFTKMELPVHKIHMNSVDDQELIKLVTEYTHYLHKLERAYMSWAMNIYKNLTRRSWRFLTPRQKMYIATNPMPNEDRPKSLLNSPAARPILVRADTQRVIIARLDVIKVLFRKVKVLEEAIHMRRVHIATIIRNPSDSPMLNQLLQFTPQLQSVYDSARKPSMSAFVTFKEPRFAYQALQMLLHSSVDGFTMSVSPAPAPDEVLWDSLSKSFLDRKIKTGLIAFLVFFISLIWVYPTYYISSLATFWTSPYSSNNVLLLFLDQFLPPILVFLFAKCAPYLFEYFSYQQCFDSKIQADCATLSKYFYFLMLNVHFVFTLLISAWGTSDAIFSNPLQWVEAVSVSFPGGATFFINYVSY
jgi:Calcium-dependent channel, 7TM region, putative phosphate/Cytosolic domain of 10TM putative phosphate transporter